MNHATAAAAKLHIDLSEALDFPSRHGFSPPRNPEDLLRSRNLDGKPPWLNPREQVTISHVIKAAAKMEMKMTTSDVHKLIRHLNMQVASFDADWLDDDSATVLLASCDDIDDPDIGDIAAVAHQFGISLNEAGQRLEKIGVAVPAIPTSPPAVDIQLLSQNLSGRRPWLRRDRPVPPHHFLRAQWRFGTAPERVAGQLEELGYATVLCEQKPKTCAFSAGRTCTAPWTSTSLCRRSTPPEGLVAEFAAALRGERERAGIRHIRPWREGSTGPRPACPRRLADERCRHGRRPKRSSGRVGHRPEYVATAMGTVP